MYQQQPYFTSPFFWVIVPHQRVTDDRSFENPRRTTAFLQKVGHKSSGETIQHPTRTDVPTVALRKDENSNRSGCFVRAVSVLVRISFVPQTVVDFHRSVQKVHGDRLRHRPYPRLLHSCLYRQ